MLALFLPLCFVVLSLLSLSADPLPASAYPGLRQPDGSLLPSLSGYLGKDLHTLTLTLDPEMLKRRNNFGYTDEQVQKYFSVPVKLTIDDTGLETNFIKPPPAPGIHPRVIFNPEDIPSIKARLEKTQAGQATWQAIHTHLLETITGPTAKLGAMYSDMVAGKDVESLDKDVAYCLMYEAFRCLIENDTEGGKKVAAAIVSLAKITQKEFDAILANPRNANAPRDFQGMGQGPTREGTLGLDYDFAYNFMTQDQRDLVRKTLSNTTTGMSGIGCETLRSLHTGTSNWISWCSGRGLFAVTAIEGEPGFDPVAYHNFASAQTNFIASMYPTGEAFEGWGKNFMFLEHMIIVAKRDKNLATIGSTAVRSAYNNYFVASLVPWGNSFTFCDSLARSGCKIARNADVLMYHTLFPSDLAGAFIYRNQIEGEYNSESRSVNTHHPFAVMDTLCSAIFASDMNPGSWDEELAKVTKDRPLTYFSEDTCNMITRSSWDKNALYLNYLNRAIPGGHQYSDRSHFSLYGLGRFWSIYHNSRQIHEQYMPTMRSVLLADDTGASVMEAKCVAMTDQPLATFEATDLSAAWNYQTRGLVKEPKGTTLISNPFTYNQFRLHPSPLPWMDYPIGHLPNWQSSENPYPENADPTKKPPGEDWYQRYTVKKAFRTIGLVRGPHPYSLVVDDLQLDDQSHHYDWGMVLDDDVTFASYTLTSPTPNACQADLLLDEQVKPDKINPTPANDRHLLVRVLSAAQLDAQSGSVSILDMPNPPQRNMKVNKLHLTSDSVSPEFKILLFAYRTGDALPKTSWSSDKKAVTISWADQTDVVSFAAGDDGRTRLKIARNGGEKVEIQ